MTHLGFTIWHTALYVCLFIVLLISACTDLRHRRIPNILTYSMALLALVVNSLTNGLCGFLFSLGGIITGLAILITPYFKGGMGAGDVKLLSAVGAVLGFNQTVLCFIFIAICGGIITIGFLASRYNLTKTFLAVLRLGHQDTLLLKSDKRKIPQEGIPYGVAIASGVFLFFIINSQSLPIFQKF